MKIANCEQSSKHTALRGRICWQRRCYSVCKTLIPLLRLMLTSRVSSGAPGVPAAGGAARHRGCALKEPRGSFRLGEGLVLANPESPRGDHACPGAALPAGDMGSGGSVPRKGQQDGFASEGQIPFRSCICSASTEQVTGTKRTARLPLLPLGQEPGSGSSTIFIPHTRL